MKKEFEELSSYSFQSTINWLMAVMVLHFLTLPEITETVFFKYTFYLAFIICLINVYLNLQKIDNFKEKYKEKINTNVLVMKEEISKRSIIDYLKAFPSEQPYVFMSVLGLIILNQYFNISDNFYQNISNTPILNVIFIPSLFVSVLLLVFGDYAKNIVNYYIRWVFKFFFYLHSPIILAVFILGLLSPLILLGVGIIQGIYSINEITDIRLMFSTWLKDLSNIYWLAVYPVALMYVSKNSWIHKYREYTKKVPQENLL